MTTEITIAGKESKTELSIAIHGNGSTNEAIIRLITNHNEGKVDYVTLDLIEAYCKAYCAQWPNSSPKMELLRNLGEGSLSIKENDKKTITVYEKVVMEFDLTK